MTIDILVEDFESFFEAPFKIYPENSPYVSLLKADLARVFDKKLNPMLVNSGMELTYFTAKRNGKLVGRITAHEHIASNLKYEEKKCFFGHFDCVDNLEVAKCLLTQVEEWAKKRNLKKLIGNFNLTAMQQCGVVTEHFDRTVYTDQVWSPEYLPSLLEYCGFQKTFPMSTFEIKIGGSTPEFTKKAEIRFDKISGKNFKKQMQDTCTVLNEGFANNPMFVPLTHEEFWFQAKEMLLIMDKKISLLAYQKNKPVGVLVCIPDLNPLFKSIRSRYSFTLPFHFLKHKFSNKRAIIIFYSVVPECWGQGLNSAMFSEVYQQLQAGGYESLGITWIADVNKGSLRQVEKFGGKLLNRLHLFEKDL